MGWPLWLILEVARPQHWPDSAGLLRIPSQAPAAPDFPSEPPSWGSSSAAGGSAGLGTRPVQTGVGPRPSASAHPGQPPSHSTNPAHHCCLGRTGLVSCSASSAPSLPGALAKLPNWLFPDSNLGWIPVLLQRSCWVGDWLRLTGSSGDKAPSWQPPGDTAACGETPCGHGSGLMSDEFLRGPHTSGPGLEERVEPLEQMWPLGGTNVSFHIKVQSPGRDCVASAQGARVLCLLKTCVLLSDHMCPDPPGPTCCHT